MGDLNLDYKKKHDINYKQASFFDLFEEILGDLHLLQLGNFATWSRVVGLNMRSSILDHIYVGNVKLLKNVTKLKPIFGDHLLIMAQLCTGRTEQKIYVKRDWRLYNKTKLVNCIDILFIIYMGVCVFIPSNFLPLCLLCLLGDKPNQKRFCFKLRSFPTYV